MTYQPVTFPAEDLERDENGNVIRYEVEMSVEQRPPWAPKCKTHHCRMQLWHDPVGNSVWRCPQCPPCPKCPPVVP